MHAFLHDPVKLVHYRSMILLTLDMDLSNLALLHYIGPNLTHHKFSLFSNGFWNVRHNNLDYIALPWVDSSLKLHQIARLLSLK